LRPARFVFIAITMVIFMNKAFAKDESLGLFSLGYNLYGAPTQISLRGNAYQMVMRGDTVNNKMRGIGVFEGEIDSETQRALEGIYRDGPRDGRGSTPMPLIDRFVITFFAEGAKKAKLDALPSIKINQRGEMLVSLEFRNSGNESVIFESPKKWVGLTNRMTGSSYVTMVGENEQSKSSSDDLILISEIGGKQVIGPSNLDDNALEIPAGQTRSVEFIAFPQKLIKKGAYILGATIAMNKIFAPASLSGTVQFSSLNGRAVFSRDYPSTPEEIRAFQAHQQGR
jgi:hypothetical protein